MTNDSTTTRLSVTELRQGKAGKSRTDLARLRRMSEAELDSAIARDPDWNQVPKDWHLRAEAAMPIRKQLVSVRFDTDVLDWFRAAGAGYQTRMNAVLRAFMESERRRRAG